MPYKNVDVPNKIITIILVTLSISNDVIITNTNNKQINNNSLT